MGDFKELLKRHNLPSNFEGRIVKRPMGAKRQPSLKSGADARLRRSCTMTVLPVPVTPVKKTG